MVSLINRRILCLLFAIFLMLNGTHYPILNWDIIGYTAAAHFNAGLRGEELHKTTYDEIQTVVPAEVFDELTRSTYRETVASNPVSLEQHMPFYTIRMGYLWALAAAATVLKISVAQATYWVASFFAALCIIVLGSLFSLPYLWWFFLFPIALHIAGFRDLAALSTPDSFSAFLALLTWWLYSKGWLWRALVPLTFLPFVRTDFILVAGLLATFLLFKKRWAQGIAFAALPALAYLFVNKINANYGYLKIFNFTLIEIDPFPATMQIRTSLAPYLQAYLAGFSHLVGHKHFIIFVFYAICWFKYIRPRKNALMNEQVTLVLGFVLLHMLLFPAYYPRFFSWCAAMAALQLITWVHEIKTQKLPFSEKTL